MKRPNKKSGNPNPNPQPKGNPGGTYIAPQGNKKWRMTNTQRTQVKLAKLDLRGKQAKTEAARAVGTAIAKSLVPLGTSKIAGDASSNIAMKAIEQKAKATQRDVINSDLAALTGNADTKGNNASNNEEAAITRTK